MDDKHLAWFLGPKAENSVLFIETLTDIIQDYIHWRRNYYPSDNLLITKRMQRGHEEEHDKLQQNVIEMLSLLRRNFPFYSPRYIGHMLSDVSMPAMLGYFAGMLYNPNNVTAEAAPVTVEWEIESCNEILKMLGYKPSPSPPKEKGTKEDWEVYEKELKTQFGWAHITSGGTVANIEAIWVARIVKYFPLAIQEVAANEDLKIMIRKPDEVHKAKLENRAPLNIDIQSFKKSEVINIKPNESIYLYAKFIDAVKQTNHITDPEKANKLATELLDKSEYSLGSHIGKVFSEFPPVIFTSGAAHYSVKKAADILGIGRNSVIVVKTDSQFRMDVGDLEKKINQEIEKGKFPLAVVAIGSTTEEGAVDPVHDILKLRKKFENEKNISFWLHVDSAWGGHISSLFRLEEDEEMGLILNKILRQLNIVKPEDSPLQEKILSVIASFENDTYDNQHTDELKIPEFTEESRSTQSVEGFAGRIESLKLAVVLKGHQLFINELKKLIVDFGAKITFRNNPAAIDVLRDGEIFELNPADRSDDISEFVSDRITIELGTYKRDRIIKWGGKPLISSFLAF